METYLHRMKLSFILLPFALLVFQISEAQSLKRQTTSSLSSTGKIGDIVVHQTIGQPYFTRGHNGNNTIVRPGFEQPLNYKLNIKSSSSNLDLSVYPNPATSSITIKSTNQISNTLIHITDLNGRLIAEEEVSAFQTHVINCENWNNGSYIIRVIDDQKNNYSSMIVINK